MGGQNVRTPLVIATDKKLRAYAVVEATSPMPGQCANTSRLFVSTSLTDAFRLVYEIKPPAAKETENSLGPVGWSVNGRWLLVELYAGYYGSDAGGTGILLYDRKIGKAYLPDWKRLFKKTLKRDCEAVFRVVGFDASSRIVLGLSDLYDPGEDQPRTHCFNGVEEWAIDPQGKEMVRVATNR